ncbi:prolyl oligopeptidase family serine peptidase [Aquimarina longa]|uniref:prolyl oligopeptidase family serine peptidase n=1 Tax=Aquimarina longa TaxID=1080221 RepID=UPI000783C813|nr:prolyl oligopeptidase family serine peptidase [Aquimarina longa]
MAIDIYHDQKVEDPYRNIENLEDSTVVDWLEAQSDLAFKTLNTIPKRQFLIDKQKEFDQEKAYQVSNITSTANGSYFYIKTMAREDIGKLYYRPDIDAEEILLYDPYQYKKNSEDKYVINYIQPDWDGKKIAVSLSKQGEEISDVFVIDVKTNSVLSGVVKNCNPNIGGLQWLPDNSGFIYLYFPLVDTKDPTYGLNSKSVVYILGSDSEELQEVFSKTNNPVLNLKPEDYPLVHIYKDYDAFVFAEVSGSSSFKDMYFKAKEDLLTDETSWELLYQQSDMVEKVVLVNNDILFLSAKNSSNYHIAKTSMINPDFETPEILIPESNDGVIKDFEVTKDGIFFVRVKNGVEAKLYHFIEGKEKEIEIPNPSGKIGISSKGPKYDFLQVSTYGWIKDNTSYEYDFDKNTFKSLHLDPLSHYKDFQDLIVEEVEVTSHDGVMVPMSIIYKKGIKKDGSSSTLFYGYGSYGYSTGPFFSTGFLSWVTEGGILAIAHVRGGGEKGETWHKAGFKTTKFNTWKDMIACTKYMIKERYTSSEKSAIWGTSAGGIMAGRAMTERPDLYAAVVLVSPAVNMLRCETRTNGANNIKEFGTVKIKEEFEALLAMDVYHHIKKNVEYPATLVTAGVKDGRVVVWDPAKFVARLQAYNSADHPTLFAVDYESGHGGMNNTKLKAYELYANALSFAFWQTGHPEYQPE